VAAVLIGYARRSRHEPAPTRQLDALRAAGCSRLFADEPGPHRPQLDAALEVMSAGDVLVVRRLDRLASSLHQLIATVTALDLHGLGLRALGEPLDTTTPEGRLVFHIFRALADFERGVARERSLDGLAEARAHGRLGGRPPALSAEDLAHARALLRDPRITVTQVAKRLGVAPSTLYRHLPGGRRNPES